jgi:hypothetical protein
MLLATVKSTTLATVAYDEAQELLQLEFCSGAILPLLRRSRGGAPSTA